MRLSSFRSSANVRAAARAGAAVVALVCAGVLIPANSAQAQTAPASPAPASSPAGQAIPPGTPSTGTNPSGGQPSVPVRPVAAPAALSHLPIIDFVTTFTQPAYYKNNTQIKNFDPLDLGGTVRIPVTRRFSLFFDRITEGTLNQPLEAQLTNGVPVLPATSRDIIVQYHGTYNVTRNFTVDLGDSFRHRLYNSGGSGVSGAPFPASVSSTEHHFAYLGFTYTTKPIKGFFNSSFVLAETLDAQNVDHHVGVVCTAANVTLGTFGCTRAGSVGYRDENPGTNRYYETTQGVTWLLPVDFKHGTVFTMNERWGALNFYENQPYPFRFNTALSYVLSKRFSPGFTLALRHQDYHEAIIGIPFAAPSVVHVGSWDVIGTFHLDTNTLVH